MLVGDAGVFYPKVVCNQTLCLVYSQWVQRVGIIIFYVHKIITSYRFRAYMC